MESSKAKNDQSSTLKIGFPVKCHYRGSHNALGKRGAHLWISQGRIGHGVAKLTHGFPLSEVSSVDVNEREFGGSDEKFLFAAGAGYRGGPGAGGIPASRPKIMTDITVRTKDGQEAVWVVEGRRADWVRERLTPVLKHSGIPYYDDLPPQERTG